MTVGAGEHTFRLEAKFRLESGVLVLFGPSGSGKSLTLEVLAGLVRPHSGRVVAAGEPLFDTARGLAVPAHRRRVGYVPQRESLFPFRSVAENVAFGLPAARRRRARSDPEVVGLLTEVGMIHRADARPRELSGGERQRVALARALAVRPRLLLLDEPFASIDRAGRRELGALLRTSLATRDTAAVLVTHDASEARALGDWAVRYSAGRTVAVGRPGPLLSEPAANGDSSCCQR